MKFLKVKRADDSFCRFLDVEWVGSCKVQHFVDPLKPIAVLPDRLWDFTHTTFRDCITVRNATLPTSIISFNRKHLNKLHNKRFHQLHLHHHACFALFPNNVCEYLCNCNFHQLTMINGNDSKLTSSLKFNC